MQRRLVDEVHGVIEEEWLVALGVAADEIEAELLDDVGVVILLGRGDFLAVLDITILPIPTTRGGIGAVLVEAPVARRLTDLPPLARLAGRVTRLLEQLRHGTLVLGQRARRTRTPRGVGKPARAKRITTGHQHATRRSAERRGITCLEARACRGQLVDVRRRMNVRTITTHAIDAEVIGKDKDDVWLLRRVDSLCHRRGGGQAECKDAWNNPCVHDVGFG